MELGRYITAMEKEFRRHASAKQAAGAKAYMRNQFEYTGLSTPVRRRLLKEFIRQNGIPTPGQMEEFVMLMWKKEEREFQYSAMEIFHLQKKNFRKSDLAVFGYMITHRPWWDTVDFIAPKLAGEYFRLFPREIKKTIRQWLSSGNTWLIRSAILFQLNYKSETDEKLLFSICSSQSMHEDFFIRKGIGWALRQYARTNPSAVRRFVSTHKLSPLSKREAMKHL
ncbi:MAG TPA: DNA alkylation repair protein [Bacteroidia bacterium]|nr:DNA alkylation repair protein [Bacteroidia bacterium]